MTEAIINYHQQQAELAKNLFTKHVKLSHPGSDVNNPFFTPSLNNELLSSDYFTNHEINPSYVVKLNDISEKMGFSRLLYYLYLYLGRDDQEFTIHNYTFLSLKEVGKRYNNFNQHNQTKICDLALTYLGMGHLQVLSLSLQEKKIYFRHDGGSNGWDQENSWKFSLSLDPSQYPDHLYCLDSFLKGELQDEDVKMVSNY